MLLRESLFCRKCGTSARVRALLQAFLKDCRINNSDSSGVSGLAVQKNFSILGINQIGNSKYLSELLDEKFNYTETTYEPESKFGSIINDRQNENVLDLTFQENTFDFLFHSDVLEHVPDWETALSECFRVLKPNGKIVFTTPIHDYRRETDKRFTMLGTQIHSTGVEIYHGKAGGIFSMIPAQKDFLEMYQFGIDFEAELKKIFPVVDKVKFILGHSDHSTEVFVITKSNFVY
jgi:SAM-dependent methyltransferase